MISLKGTSSPKSLVIRATTSDTGPLNQAVCLMVEVSLLVMTLIRWRAKVMAYSIWVSWISCIRGDVAYFVKRDFNLEGKTHYLVKGICQPYGKLGAIFKTSVHVRDVSTCFSIGVKLQMGIAQDVLRASYTAKSPYGNDKKKEDRYRDDYDMEQETRDLDVEVKQMKVFKAGYGVTTPQGLRRTRVGWNISLV
ncbi:hypothetical protein Tco_0713775 [Tanacetum coccineum]